MQPTRRQFIATLAASAALGAFPRALQAAAEAGPVPLPPPGRRLLTGAKHEMYVFDADSFALSRSVDVGFIPHSFLPHPLRPASVWLVQRKGIKPDGTYTLSDRSEVFVPFRVAEVDMEAGKVVRTFTAAPGSEFRGHGFFAPGSDVLFISRIDREHNRAYLTGYDTGNGYKVVADYPLAPGSLHDARLAADGKTAFVTTSGWGASGGIIGKGAVRRVDIETGKTLTVSLVEAEGQGISHFEPLGDGRIIGVSKSVDAEDGRVEGKMGAVFIGKEGETLYELPFNEHMIQTGKASEFFSVAVNEQDGIAAISDYTNKLLIGVELASASYSSCRKLPVFGAAFDAKARRFIAYGEGFELFDGRLESRTGRKERPRTQPGAFGGGHAVIL